MQCSIITFKELLIDNDIFRFDADYFRPKSYTLYKNIKNKRYTRIKNSFRVTKLAGFEYTKYFTFQNMNSDSFYTVLTSKNIQNEDLILNDFLKIDKKISDEFLGRSKLQKNDIVLSYTGEYRRSLVLEEDNLQLGPNICLLRAKNNNINPFYLSTFLNSEAGQLLLEREKTLSAQPTVAMSRIREIPVPLFSENFQNLVKKIIVVTKLNRKESNEFYSQAEQLLLSELELLNWKPKQELAFIKNFSATQQAERFDAEYFQPKYEEIMESVRKYKDGFDELGNLVQIKKSIEPGSEAYQENGIPFVRVSNLSKFELSDNNQQFISEKLYDELKIYQPKKDEILLSKDATPGIAYYLNEEPKQMIVSGGILRLKILSQKILPEYLTLALNSVIVQKQIERDVGGSVINHWRPDQVKLTIIPILENAKQKEIKELIEQSFFYRKQSKSLLEIAKRGVEIAIEKSEEEAEQWINYNLTELKKLKNI